MPSVSDVFDKSLTIVIEGHLVTIVVKYFLFQFLPFVSEERIFKVSHS